MKIAGSDVEYQSIEFDLQSQHEIRAMAKTTWVWEFAIVKSTAAASDNGGGRPQDYAEVRGLTPVPNLGLLADKTGQVGEDRFRRLFRGIA